MRLQYQLANAQWIDCGGRTEEFLYRCQVNNGADTDGHFLSREEAIKLLESGKTLRNDPADWYSNCRDGEYAERQAEKRAQQLQSVPLVKCGCGHSVPKSQVMSASLGTSCPNCYDEMSL